MNKDIVEAWLCLRYKKIEPILLGWSSDLKYKGYFEPSQSYHFIRVNPIKDLLVEQHRYNQMRILSKQGLPIQKPVSFEIHDDLIFQIFEWIEADSLEEILPSLDSTTQYELGIQAGVFLKHIHACPSISSSDWTSAILRKYNRKLIAYHQCGIRLDQEEAYLKSLNIDDKHFNHRPITFQHGDYHVGNMLYANGELIVIDFNRSSDGDPWQDFDRIAFSAKVSPMFAKGQINGYFDHQPPLEFYTLLRFYLSLNVISSIPWAIPLGEKDVEVMQNIATFIDGWYKGDDIPVWMKSGDVLG